ncbi:MAG TPA: flippase-like domain-containing protein [Stellaceae bacterium]|jgi:putative membrane protein|nr:flippase-like domain-containing protein [Stellaceae bacterium]
MRIAVLLLFAGLAAATALIAWFDAGSILATLEAVGWGGFLLVCAFHFCLIALNGVAWQVLTPDEPARRWPVFIWARLVRTAAAEVLPLSQLGGPAAGIRLAILHDVPAALAAASVIVDVALEFLTQLIYAMIGIVLLITARPATDLVLPAVAWLFVAVGLCVAFFVVQRRGSHLLERFEPLIARHFSNALPGKVESITEAIARIHAEHGRLAFAALLHLLEWLATGAEAWFALWLMNVPLSFAAATGIEGLLYAVRSAAFMVPMAAGVQEGGYLLVGAAFGLSPDQALALSLLKRGRDLALGVPPLLGWQILEGGQLWRGRGTAPRRSEPQERGKGTGD